MTSLTEKPDLKAIEEYINRLSMLIAEDVAETRKRRARFQTIDDWDLAQIEIQHEEALHIVRTYDMRRERYELESRLNFLGAAHELGVDL
jgi:hypothetical protein